MNPQNNLILIKGDDKTEAIESCTYSSGRYAVKFHQSQKTYEYYTQNLTWYREPEELNLQDAKVFTKGKEVYYVEAVMKFGDYHRVFYKNGTHKLFRQNELQIQKSCLENKKSRDVLAYFRSLASVISLKTDEGKALMAKKYEELTFIGPETALATYLNPETHLIRSKVSENHIFPFGCNLSQKAAVQNAMNHSISVIEGPPGTGKTQTILNIIANILMQDKNVAIVSNNNTATLNVLEKLQKYELGFIAAYLGNKENKQQFIENGQTSIGTLPTDQMGNLVELQNEINQLNNELNKMLQLKNEQALKQQMIDELILEKKHFEEYFDETYSDKDQFKFKKKISSARSLKLWVKAESVVERGKSNQLSIIERIIMWFMYGIGVYHFFSQPIERIIPILQKMYYTTKLGELQAEFDRNHELLSSFNFNGKMSEMTAQSLVLLKTKLGTRYHGKVRPRFTQDDLWKNKLVLEVLR